VNSPQDMALGIGYESLIFELEDEWISKVSLLCANLAEKAPEKN
jgi:hypothetical protein